MAMVESRVALDAGSVSACSGPRARAIPQRTRRKVERSVHWAVNDAGLEASVSVPKSDCGVHDTASKLWCLRPTASRTLAVLQPGSLCRGLTGLSTTCYTQLRFLPQHRPHLLLQNYRLRTMAPNLAVLQCRMIHDMIISNELKAAQMADAAGCSVRAVKYVRSNLRAFRSVEAPWNGGGRPRSVTPIMLDALREHLLEKPDRYLDELAVFLWDEFEAMVITSIISRTLKAAGWSKKACRRVASGRNANLRDYYLRNLSSIRSYHLIYVYESGCDKRGGRDGLLFARRLSRSLDTDVSSSGRYCRRTHRMEFYYRVCSRAPLLVPS
jgi:hypothetical protein